MFRKIVFYDNYTDMLTGTWWALLLQGLFFLIFGLAILLVPHLLEVIIAVSFFLIAATQIGLAIATRSMRSRYKKLRKEFWES